MSPIVFGIAALVVIAGMAGMGGGGQSQREPERGGGGGGGGGGGRATGPTRLPPGRPGKWFTWAELVKSRSGFDNTPTPQAASAMMLTVGRVMDPLREHLQRPVKVTSGYRSPAVNAATAGSSDTSQHMAGEAFDFKVPAYMTEDGTTIPAMGAEDVARLILRLGLPFDQVIWYTPGRGGHVHVAYSASHAPRMDLRWAPEGSDRELPWSPA